jgi:hypothetical protein
MPYALFSGSEKISDAYRNRSELWQRAKEAGLVHDVDHSKKPRKVLDEGYEIRPCDPDAADPHH